MGENCMSNRLNNKNEYISLVTMREKKTIVKVNTPCFSYNNTSSCTFFIKYFLRGIIWQFFFFMNISIFICILLFHISYFALLAFDICIVRMVFLYPCDSYCIGKDVLARYFWHFFLQNIK